MSQIIIASGPVIVEENKVLLNKDTKDPFWKFCGGRVEGDEFNIKNTASREIKEEMGVDIKIKELLGRSEYIATHPIDGKIRKQVVFFLGETDYKDLTLEKECGGLDDAKWFHMEEVASLKMYDNMIPLLTKAVEILTKD